MADSNEFVSYRVVKDQRTTDRRDTLWVAGGTVLFGLAGVIAYSFCRERGGCATFSGALLISSASAIVGLFIGFLFGIPKSVEPAPSNNRPREVTAGEAPLFRANTNLEQIADWLTKILVGLGLTQMNDIGKGFSKAADVGAALLVHGNEVSTTAHAAALSFILYFLIAGFFMGYLLTRIVLSGTFARAESDLVGRKARETLLEPSLVPSKSGEMLLSLGDKAKTIARDVARIPIEKLHKVEDLRAWARAHMGKKEYDKALHAFDLALKSEPENLQLQQERAFVLSAMNENKQSIIELEKAYEQISPTTDRSVKTQIIEGLMFNYLYEPAPDGFQRARDLGETATQRGLKDSPHLWVYLACAYGQQHAWLKEQQADPSDLKGVRDKALDAVKMAIKIAPDRKGLLRSLWDGSGREDNDLTTFNDDEEFRKVLL